ncbi:MAG: S8 family serine peptidase [Bacteroidia bacterium]|nr:S8 family serine peptidase [Bacteroidia bacterium]
MMNVHCRRLLLLVVVLTCYVLPADAQSVWWILLADKGPDAAAHLATPEVFLSREALERRSEKGIPVTVEDLPVYTAYQEAVQEKGFQVLGHSRWLNALAVTATPADLARLQGVSWVRGMRPAARLTLAHYPETNTTEALDALPQGIAYGKAETQNTMIHVQDLHTKGFTGRGVIVAVFDAGFPGVDKVAAFDSLRSEKRILHTWDFVENNDAVYEDNNHGTQVLSTIAANLPGEMVGTAPHASFILCRTEDARSERQIEEYNWLRAMEWVDSIGVDMIHSSLGYNEFDEPSESYTYPQLDGNTAIITRAADMAAARGILVTTSAGNSGQDEWRFIGAPCDADSVLCIGSVDRNQKKSGFSSFGPAADGRIKPDVTAMGSSSAVIMPSGTVSTASGTSFSGPIVAGMVACLKQAHPKRSNMDIIQAIRLSADQYAFPDSAYGYGIPHAGKADSLLANVQDLSTVRIVMSQKPVRTVKRPAAPTVSLTTGATTTLTVDQEAVLIRAATDITGVTLMRGKQTVYLDGAEITRTGNTARINKQYLIAGDYIITITTTQATENLLLKLP